MSYKGVTKEDLETMQRNGLSFAEEQQLFWKKEDYLEVDKDKEIERLNNIIEKALEKSKDLQYNFGYVLDDLIYLLMQGSDKE